MDLEELYKKQHQVRNLHAEYYACAEKLNTIRSGDSFAVLELEEQIILLYHRFVSASTELETCYSRLRFSKMFRGNSFYNKRQICADKRDAMKSHFENLLKEKIPSLLEFEPY